ncbi:MAG TPA: M20 family metallopeptidase [Anaerolineales bacterium]|nr:M20 family metallopeptidase [Anaerolineales bacterium]
MDLSEWIESNRSMFIELSNEVWGYAELGYKEFESSKTLVDAFEEAGFTLERGVADIPTAFVATYGNGEGPVIGILGEFDALPGLSQDCVPYRKPLKDGAPGHGCGHNLLGVAGLASVMAIKQAIDTGEVKGTIKYFGCPAEEGGAGKAFMANAGVFDGTDICLTWHPDTFNGTMYANFLANYRVTFKFRGKTAHAAADPFNGRSALDAVELMNVGVNYLREHMIPDARVHYVTIHGGGVAPNVVPDYAASLYSVRAPRTDQLDALFERVKNIARGAALMTETEVEIEVISGMSNMLPNETVNEVLQSKLEDVGAPKFTEEEHAFARELSKSIPPDSLETSAYVYGLDSKAVAALKHKVLFEDILPPFKSEVILPGSTDVGDVSWVVPTGQIVTTCWTLGSPGHSWQIVAQGKMGIGQRGMLYAGKVMASAALEFMQNDSLREKARNEFKEKRAAANYISPIPPGIKPPLNI